MGGLTRPPFVDEILAALPMSDDGTAHVADCGYTHENPKCGCYSLPTRIEAIVRRHVAAALTEAADAIEHANLGLCDCGHDQGGEHNSLGCYGVVDYGLWTQRACDCRRTDEENPTNDLAARIVRAQIPPP